MQGRLTSMCERLRLAFHPGRQRAQQHVRNRFNSLPTQKSPTNTAATGKHYPSTPFWLGLAAQENPARAPFVLDVLSCGVEVIHGGRFIWCFTGREYRGTAGPLRQVCGIQVPSPLYTEAERIRSLVMSYYCCSLSAFVSFQNQSSANCILNMYRDCYR